jgi:hypothetical protein
MSGPRLVVDLAAWLLPSWASDRYASEFHAELAELGWWRRWAHALMVVATAYPLRLAVLRSAAVTAGFQAPPLHCLMGFGHAFRFVANEDGERYRRCRRCGIDDPHLGRGKSDWATGLQLGSITSWS